MGTVFKKTHTKPLPELAEVSVRNGQELAQWKTRDGKKRTASVIVGKNGLRRARLEAATYTAKYRDGSGIVREVSTGCRSKDAARAVLAELESRAEKVRSGIVTRAEDAAMDWQTVSLARHIEAYQEHLQARGTTPRHVADRKAQLDRVFADCGFVRLGDLDRTSFERWLNARGAEGMSAARRNVYQSAIIAFGNWAVLAKRLLANPFMGMPKANERTDRRRVRRSLTEDEIRRLVDVASHRPLQQSLYAQGPNKELALSAKERERLTRTGRERALVYKTLILTGLRLNELRSITVGQVTLETRRPPASPWPPPTRKRVGAPRFPSEETWRKR